MIESPLRGHDRTATSGLESGSLHLHDKLFTDGCNKKGRPFRVTFRARAPEPCTNRKVSGQFLPRRVWSEPSFAWPVLFGACPPSSGLVFYRKRYNNEKTEHNFLKNASFPR